MELFIIRHGQSEANVVTYDMPDPELTALGRKQAEEVSECMKEVKLDHLLSSPLIRAIDTALPLAKKLDMPIEIWKYTYEERGLSPYRGPTKEALQKRYAPMRFHNEMEPEGWYYPGEETSESAQLRSDLVYEDLLAEYRGKRVALFAHGNFNRRLLLSFLGNKHDSQIYFDKSNGSIYHVSIKESQKTIHYMGEMNRMFNKL